MCATLALAQIVFFSPCIGVRSAHAETPAAVDAPQTQTEQRRVEAKERFLRGVELTRNADWDGALSEFMASRELFPTKVALENSAVCLTNLKRYQEAEQAYRELLAQFGSTLSAPDRAKVDEAIARVTVFVGELQLDIDQAGAAVVIDGRERGTSPLAGPLSTNVGTHSVRISRDGFETYEAQIVVAGKQRRTVAVSLKRLRRSGVLVVKEAEGRALDLVLDGATIGKTPWSGSVAVGTHSVALKGEGELGTPPSAAEVKAQNTTSLVLRAVKLDARLTVEPEPANAQVDLDGVNVGVGIWQGSLASGPHHVEVYATGHVPIRRDVMLPSGKTTTLRVALERDLTNPMWKVGFRQHLYAEALFGAGLAPSLGGGADSSCGGSVVFPSGSRFDTCKNRGIPFGFIAGIRGGYQLTSGLGLEALLGYLQLSESMTRRLVARVDSDVPVASSDYQDKTGLKAPLAALSASYQFGKEWPIIARLSVGAARAHVVTSNRGTFAGQIPLASDPTNLASFSEALSVPEESQNLWLPFVGPEVRVGRHVSKRVSVELGVAWWIIFGPKSPRSGRNNVSPAGTRAAPTSTVPGAYQVDTDGDGVADSTQALRPGLLQLPKEDAVSTIMLFAPSISARYDF